MADELRLQVIFFKTEAGHEPVREWLKTLPQEEKKIIGQDVKTIQFGWPLGMPLVRKLDKDLWEVRSHLPNRIARILFTINGTTWFFCTVSSRNPKKHRPMIGHWPNND